MYSIKFYTQLLQIFIFELVQYTYSVQIQGYIARLFPLKLIGKYLLLYNNSNLCLELHVLTTCIYNNNGSHRGHDHIVVGFTITYISVLITTKVVSSNPAHGEVYTIQHYVIKFVSDKRQVCGFLRVLRFPSTNKTDHHDIIGILLKVALNTISLTVTL